MIKLWNEICNIQRSLCYMPNIVTDITDKILLVIITPLGIQEIMNKYITPKISNSETKLSTYHQFEQKLRKKICILILGLLSCTETSTDTPYKIWKLIEHTQLPENKYTHWAKNDIMVIFWQALRLVLLWSMTSSSKKYLAIYQTTYISKLDS